MIEKKKRRRKTSSTSNNRPWVKYLCADTLLIYDVESDSAISVLLLENLCRSVLKDAGEHTQASEIIAHGSKCCYWYAIDQRVWNQIQHWMYFALWYYKCTIKITPRCYCDQGEGFVCNKNITRWIWSFWYKFKSCSVVHFCLNLIKLRLKRLSLDVIFIPICCNSSAQVHAVELKYLWRVFKCRTCRSTVYEQALGNIKR